jgi:hypothetical protein
MRLYSVSVLCTCLCLFGYWFIVDWRSMRFWAWIILFPIFHASVLYFCVWIIEYTWIKLLNLLLVIDLYELANLYELVYSVQYFWLHESAPCFPNLRIWKFISCICCMYEALRLCPYFYFLEPCYFSDYVHCISASLLWGLCCRW